MIDLLKHFDTYSLKARVFPALIGGLPILSLLSVIVPWDHVGLSHVIAGAMSVVLLFAFADVARRTGKEVQTKLGTGTTPEQWHRGNIDVPEGAKDRYRAFIAKQIGMSPPSEGLEQTDTKRANDFYLSAGNWIREHTRNTRDFSILFSDNITYGFRRNLLGLKRTALVCNVAVAAACLTLLYLHNNYLESLEHKDEKAFAVLLAVVLHSTYMILAVDAKGVREASRTYGRQMILSCETLMKRVASTQKPSARKKDGNS